jgi:branched-subunit amino acid aminotransferase/4-amino-4-deoxychorismate lyase
MTDKPFDLNLHTARLLDERAVFRCPVPPD